MPEQRVSETTLRILARIGAPSLGGLTYLGRVTLLGLRGVAASARIPFQGRRPRLAPTIHQAMLVAIRALPVLSVITFVIGLILALQSAHVLRDFGAMYLVARSVAISVTRELGPLMTAIVILGRSGSAFASEIATMKVNQELDAMEVMALDPDRLLVAPKMLAMVIMMPCLSMWSNLMAVLGGSLFGVVQGGFTWIGYMQASAEALFLTDVATGLVKSVMFGVVITAVGCAEGFATGVRPEDVGRSTTSAVVNSIFLVIAVDLVFTALFYLTRN